MSAEKRHCVMLGMCFTPELAYLLRLSEGFDRDFSVSAYAFGGQSTDFTLPEQEFERAELVMYHPASWTGWNQEHGYPQLTAQFSRDIEHITFPYPVFNFLWPCHALDPRFSTVNVGPLDDNDSLLYAYADSNVLKMRQQGKTPAEIVSEYSAMDVPDTVDLDRLFEHVVAVQRAKEAETDVKVLDFSLDRFKKQQVFSCVNHGSNLLMIHMADQILARLGYPPLPQYAHEGLCELLDPTIPIHPSIARYYNLSWRVPGMRCRIDRRRNLNWKEYIYQLAVDRTPVAHNRAAQTRDDQSTQTRDADDSHHRLVDDWIESVLQRLNEPSLEISELVDVCTAYCEIYPASQFPPLIEKKALEMALATDPESEKMKARLAQVNAVLNTQLLECDYDLTNIDESLIAGDGEEAAILALPFGKRQKDYALAAFHHYMAIGRSERYPGVLMAMVLLGNRPHVARSGCVPEPGPVVAWAGEVADAPVAAISAPATAVRQTGPGDDGKQALVEVDFQTCAIGDIVTPLVANGCVLLRNFVQPKELRALQELIDEAHEREGALHIFSKDLKNGAHDHFHEYLFHDKHAALLGEVFGRYEHRHDPQTASRRIDGRPSKGGGGWQAPLAVHIDAYIHSFDFTVNFWVPFQSCGFDTPSLGVVNASLDEIIAFSGFTGQPGVSNHRRHDTNYHYFSDVIFDLAIETLHERFAGRIATPTYEVGDAMMLTNWTLHFTHSTPQMRQRRSNVELRFSSPASVQSIRDLHAWRLPEGRELALYRPASVPMVSIESLPVREVLAERNDLRTHEVGFSNEYDLALECLRQAWKQYAGADAIAMARQYVDFVLGRQNGQNGQQDRRL